jgi:hypothetical protein
MRTASGSRRMASSISVEPRLHLAHGVGVDQVAGAQRLLEQPQHVQLVGEEPGPPPMMRFCLIA